MKLVKTYVPDNCLKSGYIKMIVDIIHEIIDNRWLIQQLFKRDFFAIYKQSFIGIFWALILPLVSVLSFVLLNKSGIFTFGDIDVPYALYAMLGISFWQLFSTGLISSSNSFVKAGSMITKINFSKKSLVIASCGQSIISFALQFVIVLILFFVYDYIPTPWIFLTPLLALPVFIFSMGLGFILSLLNGIMRDIGNVMSSLLTFLLFLTPILYAKPDFGILATITKYNPLFYLISEPRNLILKSELELPLNYALSVIFTLITFFVFLIIFHMTETRVTERI